MRRKIKQEEEKVFWEQLQERMPVKVTSEKNDLKGVGEQIVFPSNQSHAQAQTPRQELVVCLTK